MNNFDVLTHELLLLKAQLGDMPLIVGGGMGIYLRARYHAGSRQPRYPQAPPARSTKDLDFFLSADIIVNAARMNHLRDVLGQAGYTPKTEFFQFEKSVAVANDQRRVVVDLLAAPPRREDEHLVKRGGIRLRPIDSEKIHAYRTNEAQSIERGAVLIYLSTAAETFHIGLEDASILLPSAFNYLILKLHAFDDRKHDEQEDYGRHHAMDIFTIVTGMGEVDWKNARNHYADEHDQSYIKRTIAIRRDNFATRTSLGTLRLREHPSYQRDEEEFETYLPEVLKDLEELFSDRIS